jgi:hypothetical protein
MLSGQLLFLYFETFFIHFPIQAKAFSFRVYKAMLAPKQRYFLPLFMPF